MCKYVDEKKMYLDDVNLEEKGLHAYVKYLRESKCHSLLHMLHH